MPKFVLYTKFETENLSTIRVSDPSSYTWKLKFKCTKCGTETENWIFVSAENSVEAEKGPGTFHSVFKCKECKRQSSVVVMEDSSLAKIDLEAKGHEMQPLMAFDIRGAEPVAWEPMTGLLAESTEGAEFEIEMDDGEWSDYDQDHDLSVGIYAVESEWERSK